MTLEEAIARCEKIVKEAKKSYEVPVGDIMAEVGMELTKKGVEEYQQYAEWLRELQRARVLLKATHDLLEAAEDSPYVENVLAILVHYDEVDCDGSCLMEDIENYFDEFGAERRTDE